MCKSLLLRITDTHMYSSSPAVKHETRITRKDCSFLRQIPFHLTFKCHFLLWACSVKGFSVEMIWTRRVRGYNHSHLAEYFYGRTVGKCTVTCSFPWCMLWLQSGCIWVQWWSHTKPIHQLTGAWLHEQDDINKHWSPHLSSKQNKVWNYTENSVSWIFYVRHLPGWPHLNISHHPQRHKSTFWIQPPSTNIWSKKNTPTKICECLPWILELSTCSTVELGGVKCSW